MLRTGNGKLYILGVLAVIIVLGLSSAMAQSSNLSKWPDTYQVNYYSNAHGSTGVPDGTVRIDNPGTDGWANLCADVYVFDAQQEMVECCGCLLTPDDLRPFSINKNLTGNPANHGLYPTSGVIKLVSSVPNPNAAHPQWGQCDATGGTTVQNQAGNIVPTPDLRAWATHIQKGPSGWPATSESFSDSNLSAFELSYLQNTCSGIWNNDSGTGRCTCPTGSR